MEWGAFTMGDVTQSQDIWKPLMIYVIAAAYSAGAIKSFGRDDPLRDGCDCAGAFPQPQRELSQPSHL